MSKNMIVFAIVLAALSLLVGATACGGSPATGTTEVSTSTTTTSTIEDPTTTSIVAPEDLKPVVQPTLPDDVPGYLDVDPATGLHMTGTPTVVDLATYRLKVTGLVDHELSLTYDELRSLPRVTASPELVCPGYFADKAAWTGVPLKLILEMAGPQPDAAFVTLVGADNYITGLKLSDALVSGAFLAYELDGQALPVLQGFPLRAVFPGKQGSLWSKWIIEIRLDL